jgi:prepilin-type N-terminal cleavage/methylation domain-containing protein
MHRARRFGGFTMIEVAVVVGILGIAAAMAVPSWRATQRNSRLRDASGDIADALQAARARAIGSGHTFVVYFDTGVNSGADICGNALTDLQGNPVPILILDDGPPGGPDANCCIDAGDPILTTPASANVEWGVDFAAVPVPSDSDPANTFALGSTFRDPNNAPTEWVAFGPDGIPVGFANNGGPCELGTTGTGAGAIYVNNDQRDAAVVISPLGSVKVHGFERGQALWTE